MHFKDLIGKKVAVWGVGREGSAFINLWRARCPHMTLSVLDEKPSDQSRLLATQEDLCYFSEAGALNAIKTFDVVVRSPGISRYREEILEAKRLGVQFTSLADLWFSENTTTDIVAITGTKGKSTTSSLTAHLLKSLGVNTTLAGNIGTPLFEDPEQVTTQSTWVIELSSYQASDIETSIPLATLLNLYPEHCDWHGSVEQYYQDKLNIFKHQSDNSRSIINGQDPNTLRYLNFFKNRRYFNTKETIHCQDGYIYNGDQLLFPCTISPLLGTHNSLNICAALTILSALGHEPSTAADGLKNFNGLMHRLQMIGSDKKLTYIDDSISTIPQAALAALAALPSQRVTILLGGQKRAQDWELFAKSLHKTPPFAAITMPDNGSEIAAALREYAPQNILIKEVADLKEGVQTAQKITPSGGIVLLSPASPSYGHFKNFEERGDLFKQFAGLK